MHACAACWHTFSSDCVFFVSIVLQSHFVYILYLRARPRVCDTVCLSVCVQLCVCVCVQNVHLQCNLDRQLQQQHSSSYNTNIALLSYMLQQHMWIRYCVWPNNHSKYMITTTTNIHMCNIVVFVCCNNTCCCCYYLFALRQRWAQNFLFSLLFRAVLFSRRITSPQHTYTVPNPIYVCTS